MSFYSSIDRRINADKWFRDLSHLSQLMWFRLLTGPHVTPVAGLWPATEEQLARSFRLSMKAFRETFAELDGKVLADWDAGVIWFPKAIHVPANQPRNENSLRGWIKHLELVPECELRDRALTEIIVWVMSNRKRFPEGLPESFPKPLAEQFRERLTKQFPELFAEPLPKHVPRAYQDQEQEQEREQSEISLPARPPPTDRFAESFNDIRDDVRQLHDVYRKTFGLSGHTIRCASDLDAVILKAAIDLHGLDACLLVLKHAPQDGMVSGKSDERKQKHEKISYIFGNEYTFARILRDAQSREGTAGRRLPVAEAMARARAL